MKQKLKRWLFRLLGKDPDAVVVTFCTGDPELCRRMIEEVRSLVPDRRHFTVTSENWPAMRRELKRYRIGLAPVLLTREPNALRRAAYRMALRKILAYNSRLERHHLDSTWHRCCFGAECRSTASFCGPLVALAAAGTHYRPARPSPASRAAPVRRTGPAWRCSRPISLIRWRMAERCESIILLREMAREFDVELFAFTDGDPAETAPVLEFCARVVLVEKPRYREPRWSTLLPPEVHEFRSPAMRRAIAEERRAISRFERCKWNTRS